MSLLTPSSMWKARGLCTCSPHPTPIYVSTSDNRVLHVPRVDRLGPPWNWSGLASEVLGAGRDHSWGILRVLAWLALGGAWWGHVLRGHRYDWRGPTAWVTTGCRDITWQWTCPGKLGSGPCTVSKVGLVEGGQKR